MSGDGQGANRTVSKSQLLKDLANRVSQLQQTVQSERAQREKLDGWITNALRPALQKLQNERISSERKLVQLLTNEQQARAKLTVWVRENIGPHLEHVDQRIEKCIAASGVPQRKNASQKRGSGSVEENALQVQIKQLVAQEVKAQVAVALKEVQLNLARTVDKMVQQKLAQGGNVTPRSSSAPTHQPPKKNATQSHTEAQKARATGNSGAAAKSVARQPETPKKLTASQAQDMDADVMKFLRSVGCVKYAAAFHAKGYWSMRLVKCLRAEDLGELGINNTRDRDALLLGVRKLQDKRNPAQTSGGDANSSGFLGTLSSWFGGDEKPTSSPAQHANRTPSNKAQESQAARAQAQKNAARAAQQQQQAAVKKSPSGHDQRVTSSRSRENLQHSPRGAATTRNATGQTKKTPPSTTSQQKRVKTPQQQRRASGKSVSGTTTVTTAPSSNKVEDDIFGGASISHSTVSPASQENVAPANVDDVLSGAQTQRAPILKSLTRASSTTIRGRRPPSRKNIKLGSTVAVKEEPSHVPKPSSTSVFDDDQPAHGEGVTPIPHDGDGDNHHTQGSVPPPRGGIRLPPGAMAGPGAGLAAAAAAKLKERRAASQSRHESKKKPTPVAGETNIWGDSEGVKSKEAASTGNIAHMIPSVDEMEEEIEAPPMDEATRRREELARRAAQTHSSSKQRTSQMFVPSGDGGKPNFKIPRKSNAAGDGSLSRTDKGDQSASVSELERKMQARRSASHQGENTGGSGSARPTNLKEYLKAAQCLHLENVFCENGFDDMSLIKNLTAEDLEDLEIHDQAQQGRLLRISEQLNKPVFMAQKTPVSQPSQPKKSSFVKPTLGKSNDRNVGPQSGGNANSVPGGPSTAKMFTDLGKPLEHVMPSEAIARIRANDPEVKHVILSQTSIYHMKSIEYTQQLAEALKTNTHVVILELAECNITNGAASSLGAALEHNKTLEKLDLARNKIGSDGLIGLAKGLERNRTLRELILLGQSQKFGEPALRAILNMLENNYVLQHIQWRIDSRQSFAINKRLTRNRDATRLERTGKGGTSSGSIKSSKPHAQDRPVQTKSVASEPKQWSKPQSTVESTRQNVVRQSPVQSRQNIVRQSPKQPQRKVTPAKSEPFDASSIFGNDSFDDWTSGGSSTISTRGSSSTSRLGNQSKTSGGGGLFDDADRSIFAAPKSPIRPRTKKTSTSSTSSNVDDLFWA